MAEILRARPPAAARKVVKGKSAVVRQIEEIAEQCPPLDGWSVEDYLSIHSNRRIEFDTGRLEFLPMPTMSHEECIVYLFDLLRAFVRANNLGRVFFSGIRVMTDGPKFRVPDIVFMHSRNKARMEDKAWIGADLVMEVVSPDDPARDWVKKKDEYARAGIPEYWIVDPKKKQIAVLVLEGSSYSVSGKFKPGQRANSVLLKGFSVDVREALCGEKF